MNSLFPFPFSPVAAAYSVSFPCFIPPDQYPSHPSFVLGLAQLVLSNVPKAKYCYILCLRQGHLPYLVPLKEKTTHCKSSFSAKICGWKIYWTGLKRENRWVFFNCLRMPRGNDREKKGRDLFRSCPLWLMLYAVLLRKHIWSQHCLPMRSSGIFSQRNWKSFSFFCFWFNSKNKIDWTIRILCQKKISVN